MNRPPNRNLPPASEAWGRYVEDNIGTLVRDVRQNGQLATNGLGATNAALKQLSNQVATLTGVVQTLTSQQQQLTNLVNAIPVTTFQNAQVTGFQAGNGYQTRVSTTFTVPAGKTRCSIMASMQGFYVSDVSVPNSDLAAFQIAVSGGYSGPWASMTPDNMDTYWLGGNGGVQLNSVSGSVTVSINSLAGPTLAPYSGENFLALFVLATFS